MATNKDKITTHEEDARGKTGNVVVRSVSAEMKESYLDYAMSVITARALPDVRDGLKPVHRRVLYAMHGMRLTASAKTRKSAAVVGEVLGKYHPHGDIAVYDSLTKLAQDFSTRYPLIVGQGNFGSIDGDNPAAMRYTEVKMSKIAGELLRDIEKETVDWRPNYDGTHQEPIVLPAAVPNLLLNGTLGIAVGMATNIPPHNLREVANATIHLVEHPDATTEDLLSHITGPDFPTGGIAYNKKDIQHVYANGKGGVVVRGRAEVTEDAKGNAQIVISSIPFRVNKSDLVVKIADLAREKKIDGIKDLRDESTSEVRIVIELKGNAHPQKVLNYLYKHTQLEDTFHYNMVALVDGVPQTLSLKGILEEFAVHRAEVVRRRTRFDLTKAEDRGHILLGLKKALDHIDAIIALIKKAKDVPTAHRGLMAGFALSERQATAILEMKLQKLAGLERKKVEDELAEVQKLIAELSDILKSPKKILKIITDELHRVAEEYGDDRRTTIVTGGVQELFTEDLIPDEESMLVLTAGGYLKRTNPGEYRRQRRGGVGVVDISTKEEDFVTTFLTASTHSDLLFFTDRGKVYQIKMYDIPEGKRATRGKSVMNFLSLSSDERVTSVLAQPKEVKGNGGSLMMVTKHGVIKKVTAAAFTDVRRSGLIALTLRGDDQLVSAGFVKRDDHVVVTTKQGKAIRFKESDTRTMGRAASGVRAIKLTKGDEVVSADVLSLGGNKPELLVVMAKGYGKKTPLKEYKVQKRGGAGIKAANVTNKTGELVSVRIVAADDSEIVAMSKHSQVVRTGLKEIPSLGRATQGVRIMKLRDGDSIASVTCV
ncbi:DNA gyrase subunit A [Candidatus Wolfebacteria bacterium]|nr:DNA gyrase subunit A [Candidatus Wolfebacteria bacterium]